MYCDRCGNFMPDNNDHCPTCGAPTGNNSRNSKNGQKRVKNNKRKRKKANWIPLILLLILGVVAVLLFVVLKTTVFGTGNYGSEGDRLLNAKDAVEDTSYESGNKITMLGVIHNQNSNRLDRKEEENDTSNNSEERTETAKADFSYEWAVQPDIEADDMFLVRETAANTFRPNYFNSCIQYDNGYTVIKRGDALDLIDQNGKLLTGMNIQTIRHYYSYEFEFKEPANLAGKIEDPLGFMQDGFEKSVKLAGFDNGHYFVPEHGDAGCTDFYYGIDRTLHSSWELYGRTDMEENIPKLMGVPEAQREYESSDNPAIFYVTLDSNYAICSDQTIFTDYIYNACGAEADGLMAVALDGKWGYVDQTGTAVIPIEYDASWGYCIPDGDGSIPDHLYFVEADMEAFDDCFRNACYAPSDGYINLVKDGQWELRDVKGELCIAPGTFEKIMPVYKGKCWVKSNGKWGLISITDADSNEESEADCPDWLNAYASYLSTTYQGKFSLAYVDDDDIPELIIYPEDATYHLAYAKFYTYVDGALQMYIEDDRPAVLGSEMGSAIYAERTGWIMSTQMLRGEQYEIFSRVADGNVIDKKSFYSIMVQNLYTIDDVNVSEEEYHEQNSAFKEAYDFRMINPSVMFPINSDNIENMRVNPEAYFAEGSRI